MKVKMINALIGTKIGMTHTYSEAGKWLPVTRLMLGPCTVTQIKQKKTDGYPAVQLAFGKKKRLTKPLAGHLKKANLKFMPRLINEVRDRPEGIKIGDQIKVSDVFLKGDLVKVTGTTKGRGFTGVIKRWGFVAGPRTHGQSDRRRAPGSIGQGTDPGRVHRGKKMPGHSGASTKTIMNLKVIKVDGKNNELWLAGAAPGHQGALVRVSILKAAPREKKAAE